MKPLILIALVLAFFSCKSLSQQQAQIKQSAQICADAFINGDYNKLSGYTYPKLVAIAGGKDSLISKVKYGLKLLSEKGIVIGKTIIGNPGQVYKAGDELHCLVPETLTLKVKGGYYVALGYLLAVSTNNGNSWYFIDLANSTPESLKQMFPHFNNKLIIPAATKPVFHKDTI